MSAVFGNNCGVQMYKWCGIQSMLPMVCENNTQHQFTKELIIVYATKRVNYMNYLEPSKNIFNVATKSLKNEVVKLRKKTRNELKLSFKQMKKELIMMLDLDN